MTRYNRYINRIDIAINWVTRNSLVEKNELMIKYKSVNYLAFDNVTGHDWNNLKYNPIRRLILAIKRKNCLKFMVYVEANPEKKIDKNILNLLADKEAYHYTGLSLIRLSITI